jgi:hypothetical protein
VGFSQETGTPQGDPPNPLHGRYGAKAPSRPLCPGAAATGPSRFGEPQGAPSAAAVSSGGWAVQAYCCQMGDVVPEAPAKLGATTGKQAAGPGGCPE